jgi:hypothetical protein
MMESRVIIYFQAASAPLERTHRNRETPDISSLLRSLSENAPRIKNGQARVSAGLASCWRNWLSSAPYKRSLLFRSWLDALGYEYWGADGKPINKA